MTGARFRAAAGALVSACLVAGISACSKATASLGGAADNPAAACADPQTLAQVKSIIFENAAEQASSENKLLVPELGKESTIRIPSAVLDSYDKITQRTSCSGRAEIGFPSTAASVIGAPEAVAQIRYTAQPSADGSGTVFTVYGAEDMISGISAADLQGWRAIPTQSPSASSAGTSPTSSPAPPAAAPQPTAADLIQGDPQLAARDREVSDLYQNALDRDATGQVRADQQAALASRAACHTKACLEGWFDHREAALKAWQGG